ncbi:diadenosine tetraphosphate hydrolase [Actinoplanes sp. NPDC051475]|uniref:HIT family protein n=1 Tax=Actinoplanes sp. NPDC051475 TaxID=3157225 RepID=UPI00344CE188
MLARLPESFAVIGDVQWLPGYCVLLTDDVRVTRLSDLPRVRRLAFLESMERLGAAVEQACAEHDPAFLRINLEILGNTDPYLHAHIWPRYEWEPAGLRRMPVWLYPPARWKEPGPAPDALRAAITARIAVPR